MKNNRYNLMGIVPVDVSKDTPTLLDPHTVFNYDCYDDLLCYDYCSICNHKTGKWDNFDIEKYKKFVFEMAVVELQHLLHSLPNYLACIYVENSAYVNSQGKQDILCFQIDTAHEYGEKGMQLLLDNYLKPKCDCDGCRDCPNNSKCRIFNYLQDFYSLDCFQAGKSKDDTCEVKKAAELEHMEYLITGGTDTAIVREMFPHYSKETIEKMVKRVAGFCWYGDDERKGDYTL